jgi:hypothetical protein
VKTARRPRLWPYLLVIGVAIVAAILPVSPDQVERWFSIGLYPRIQRVLTPLSNAVPTALFDWLILISVIAAVTLLVRGIRAARRERRWAPAGIGLVRTLSVVAVLYLLFLSLWGFNYRRVPMRERLLFGSVAVNANDVMRLGNRAVDEMNALYPAAHQPNAFGNEWQEPSLRHAFTLAQAMLSDGPPVVPGRLKSTAFGTWFRWTSVDGMVDPFALEVLVNPDLLPFERPFVAAHEWSHLAGFADESEANFVGWLTCIRASPPAQYSGWLYLYWQISGELGEADRAKLWERVAPGPRSDIAAIRERLLRGQLPLLRMASWRIYDQYLKANRVESGVRSYGEVVTLILRARFAPGWIPVRRVP